MYLSKKQLGNMFDISPSTVWRKVKGIESEIGNRYNRYAIIENRVSVAVFVDFMKYGKMLDNKRLRKYVPDFDKFEAELYILEGVGNEKKNNQVYA